jgi:SP family general alpha glucoside:H+ symporter-like MFS transporter
MLVSAACVMEGYDMAVIGQLFAQKAFQKEFGVPIAGGHQVTALWQILLANSGNIGVIIGILLNGIISEKIRMKKTMIGAYIAITAFTFILVLWQEQCCALGGSVFVWHPLGYFQHNCPMLCLRSLPYRASRPPDDFYQSHMGHWTVDLGGPVSRCAGNGREVGL